jgi:copper chaperone CopZ
VVKRALEELKGVRRAEVSFRDKESRVTFEPGEVTVCQLIEGVERSGFGASPKRGD